MAIIFSLERVKKKTNVKNVSQALYIHDTAARFAPQEDTAIQKIGNQTGGQARREARRQGRREGTGESQPGSQPGTGTKSIPFRSPKPMGPSHGQTILLVRLCDINNPVLISP